MAVDTGVLIVNLGTPDSPTTQDVRKFLAEFLSDPRVIEIPRPIWWLVLHGTILRFRPKKVAQLYKAIWRNDGSPLLSITKKLTDKLQLVTPATCDLALGMRYGNPSLKKAINNLSDKKRIIVIPLYPQNSATTTGSVYDAILHNSKAWRNVPDLRFINSYADHPLYIKAIAKSIEAHWSEHGKAQKLLFSYHGLPQQCIDKGDPYLDECDRSTRLIVDTLGLSHDEWIMSFQSRVGPAQWLKPYTDKTLEKLPSEGIRQVDVVCPGFSVDCLETLEEIDQQNRKLFLESGGETYRYIPALNDSDLQVELLVDIIQNA